MKKFTALAFSLSLGLFAFGCGSESPTPTPLPDPVIQDPNPNPNPNPDPNSNYKTLSGSISKSGTLSGDVVLAENAVIEPGVTLTAAPGTRILAAVSRSLVVKGTLMGTGTQAQPITFGLSASATGTWAGLSVANGGNVTLSYAEIRDADFAFQAFAGTTYSLDHILIEKSNAALQLQSSGSISKTVIHGRGAMQAASPVSISDASPTFTDVTIDNANNGVDHITVTGTTASPKFDHVDLSQCHCALHFNSGASISVTNSYIHNNAYALMVYGSKNNVWTGNNLVQNAVNIGACGGGASLVATGNFFGGGMAFDSSCATQTNSSPSASMVPGAGARP